MASIAEIDGLTIASGPLTPPLDTYTGAKAAYSLRKLRTAYTGAAIEVRRDSDNTAQDIGFDTNGDLDTAAIGTFVGSGNNGYVRTLYDQSGNANDAQNTNTGQQPLIYNGTAVVTVGGKAAMQFDGTDDRFQLDVTATGLNLDVANTSSFHVAQYDNATNDQSMSLSLGGSTGNARWYSGVMDSGDFKYGYGPTTFISTETGDTNQNLFTMIAGSTLGQAQAWRNGVSKMTATLASSAIMGDTVGIGLFRTAWYLDGTVQEVIIYSSDQSINRTGIESNLTTYYGL
tara:strand:+ start:245 stop:1105 length:861 start_codon:yes stop_codon:yes gene_type:complete